MKRIGLITFCNHELKINYGQVLQAYALYKYLTLQGHEVKVINYRPPFMDEGGLWFNLFRRTYLYQERYKRKKEKKLYTKRNKKFFSFTKTMMNFTKPCYTEADVLRELEECDVFMAGSDQVWSIDAFDKIRLMGVDKKIKRVSYASSGLFVENDKANCVYRKMEEYWHNIDDISVREESGKRIIEKYIEREVEVVADPVLLLDKEQWTFYNSSVKQPYILCYFLGGSRCHMHILKHMSMKLNIKKIVFIDANDLENHKGIGDVRKDVGPKEYVKLIANASMVCTDSYHGAMFSVIFKRQFCLLKRNHKQNDTFSSTERFRIMFEQWGLNNRMIRNINDYDKLVDIDYEVLSDKINSYVCKSKKYLERVLGGENDF